MRRMTTLVRIGIVVAALAGLAVLTRVLLQGDLVYCPNAYQPVRKYVSSGVMLPVTPLRIQVGDVEYECIGDVLRPDRIGIDARCPARDRLPGSKITLLNYDKKSHCVVHAWRDVTMPGLVLASISPEVRTMDSSDDGIPAP